MFVSPFKQKKQMIVVSDAFVQQYRGGAEMTLESLLEYIQDDYELYKINSSHLTKEVLYEIKLKFPNACWLLGNFTQISADVLEDFYKNIKKYYIMECDYKYCVFRSEQLHKQQTGKNCDCHLNTRLNNIISKFYSSAKIIFWMSEKQKNISNSKLTIENVHQITLGSLFSRSNINYFKDLKNNLGIKRNNKYVVLKSPSWIKGYERAVKYCQNNNLDYEEVWGLDYNELLNKLKSSKGLVYLPEGFDTCPRLTIEAKILGCELILNKNVQQKDESWFKTIDVIFKRFEEQENIIKRIFK